jgi:Ca-activated chloride channel family protein
MRSARASGVLLVLLLATVAAAEGRFVDWWLTPDQQGQQLFARGDYAAAAERFRDPMRRGAALFRAGDFEAAAGVFGRIATAEAAFDRGNALVMLGKYEDAIASYDRALQLRPGWSQAEENRRIARIRFERRQPPEDDAGGTGGKLGADEIVFDERGAKGSGEQVAQDEQRASDQELRAIWLRRVQTRPADFLRSRFAHQLARQREEVGP